MTTGGAVPLGHKDGCTPHVIPLDSQPSRRPSPVLLPCFPEKDVNALQLMLKIEVFSVLFSCFTLVLLHREHSSAHPLLILELNSNCSSKQNNEQEHKQGEVGVNPGVGGGGYSN